MTQWKERILKCMYHWYMPWKLTLSLCHEHNKENGSQCTINYYILNLRMCIWILLSVYVLILPPIPWSLSFQNNLLSSYHITSSPLVVDIMYCSSEQHSSFCIRANFQTSKPCKGCKTSYNNESHIFPTIFYIVHLRSKLLVLTKWKILIWIFYDLEVYFEGWENISEKLATKFLMFVHMWEAVT